MPIALTPAQRDAVDSRGGALLVAAAAGSGKTRVLVERLLSRVEGEGLDVDRFLVITYTKAAAAELRARIVEELSRRLALSPADGHLRRQSALVYKAQISTVHAFCAQLLRECGHLLELNPDFRLCDEGEAGVLTLSALNDVLDGRYAALEDYPDFSLLVDTMSAGRDDAKLVQIVLDVRGRIQSHPDPAAWLDSQAGAFDLAETADVGETVWGRLLLEDARRQAAYWAERMAGVLELTACDKALSANYGPTVSATMEGLRRFCAETERGWDAARAAMPIPFPTAGRKRMPDCPEEAERVKAVRKLCKARMEKLEERFTDGSAALLADLEAVRPAVQALFALVKDFEAAYTAEKTRRGLLDFADLEHLAVKLLMGPDGTPTPLAEQWSGRFEEIMVDEYQDTNAVQNAIFSALSRRGENLFLVGDVKQSIYRFRLADPSIFLEKYRTFRPCGEAAEGEPRRVLLSQNFRSRPQVLEGVNDLFRAVMSTQFGEMDYGPDEALYPGASFPEPEGDPRRYALELDALDLSGGEAEGEQPARDLQEARFAAGRIAALLGEGFPVSNREGGQRPLRPADVVILLRSPGTVLHHYARALGERDIPWEAEGGGDFFAATEIAVALALLRIVDNPRQDVPLIAALRSPVYAFSADRLAQLRAAAGEGDFYAAVERAAREGEADCAAFLSELEGLRFGAGDRSCVQLLWHIYDQTNLLGLFGAMDEGETRQGNLLALAELAQSFEGAGHKGLFGFLSHLDRLRDSGTRLSPPAAGRTGGGVRIMSIHRSKGLEFPVVLLCGLARTLNREDLSRPILFHPKLGVGPKRLDTERMVEYPTLARQGVARQLEYEMMAEELRLLYVAMTRAQEKLILCCALTGGGRDLEGLARDAGYPVDPQVLLGCRSAAQWVLLAALLRPEALALRGAAGVLMIPAEGPFGPPWDIRWVDGAAECAPLPPRRDSRGAEVRMDGLDPEALAARLRWTYPHGADVEIPSKLTATQLKGRSLDEEVAAGTAAPPEEGPAGTQDLEPRRPVSFQRPRFAQEDMGLTPAQKGTALHLAMQFIDFQKTRSEAEIRREIARLVEQDFLTPVQGEAVNPARIAAFFAGELGRTLRAAPTLRREFKFSLLVPAAEYCPGAGEGEEILLQGVVDCCFEEAGGLTVVDFKTDRVRGPDLERRALEYRPQLAAYSRALEAITGRPVKRRVLWFFHAGRAVEI